MTARLSRVAPAEAAAAVLHTRFGDTLHERRPGGDGLEAFQADALHRIRNIIASHGGAILADSVGLGKTHVAAALVRETLSRGTVIVCGPSALKGHWTRHLRTLRGWHWISHASLSRGPARRAAPALIVIDEAHALRNPLSRRYSNLLALRAGADLLLLTATPVNNSVRDFYHLVRLFADRQAFTDIGIVDLRSAVEMAERGQVALLRRVAEAVMVRRTREFVQSAVGAAGTARLGFPRRKPVRMVGYDLTAAYPHLLSELMASLSALTFPAHSVPGLHPGAAELMRMNLLKRLESSTAAFAASLRLYRRMLSQFVIAADECRLLDVRTDRDQYRDVDGALQLSMTALALRPWPSNVSRARAMRAAKEEAKRVVDLLSHGDGAAPAAPKIRRLRQLLDGDLAGEAVLVFTEYRDTAVALRDALLPMGGLAMIHGSSAQLGRHRASRHAVINRFAPVANGVRPPPEHQRVRILIATDVLSEGLNLQDARVVVSYDLPWNPVRLAQRVGRVDRLGSPHTSVLAYAFRPERGVDEMLGLMRRVRRKLRAIRTVGGDAPLLHSRRAVPDGVDADVLEKLRAEHRRLCETRGPTVPGAPVTAAFSTHETTVPACYIWLSAGPLMLVLRVADGDATVAPIEADRILLASTSSPGLEGGSADQQRLKAAIRVARRAARAYLASQGVAPADRNARDDGRAVRRWLASRPGGPTVADTAEADRLLALARSAVAGRNAQIHRFAPRNVSLPGPAASTGLKVIALLEVVPSAGRDTA